MTDIKKIIREEIEKYILTEAIDFTNLNRLAQLLNDSLNSINDASDNEEIYEEELKKFIGNIVVYCVQIIHAINRCNQAQNLNERNAMTDVFGSFNSWGGLSDYGINIPGELGGNLIGDTKRGYNSIRNALIGRGNKTNASYGNSSDDGHEHQVPSVKLSELLQQLPQWQNSYSQYNAKFNITRYYQRIDMQLQRILNNNGIIANIEQEYHTQMRNAQGNP